MKLKYITPPVNNGGTAVSGCGTIHWSEIRNTLVKLSDDLELPFDLNDYIIGSTGKKEYSGDIDLVIDNKWWSNGPGTFRENLNKLYGIENTARNGDMIHLKYPIVGYNSEYNMLQPRTGFVQIDFNFGDSDWERFYHYSPGNNSEYKGAHRNLLIAAICSSVNVKAGFLYETQLNTLSICDNDRPESIIRWKFGQHGFSQIFRYSVKDKHGHWKKKQEDIILAGPYTNPQTIRGILFPYDTRKDDLDSLETIMEAVKRNYGMTDCERVWRRAAENFLTWKDGENFIYPDEISKYFQRNDK